MERPVDRKSSKPRIGAAGFTGSFPKFTPSDDGWLLIEQAYRRGFGVEDRAEICSIVNSFLEWHRFEKGAPFVDDVNSQIEQLEKAARQLNRILGELLDRVGQHGDAAFQAERAIKRALRGMGFLGSRNLEAVYKLTLSLVSACKRARKKIDDDARPGEGDAWEAMICKLAGFAARHGSITVRKDTDKQADAKHSPLVVFVKSIQEQFPTEVPIRFSTENSLATQISGVLARARKHGIDFRRKSKKQIPPAD